MMWDISMELHNRGYHEDALTVWNVLAIDYPTQPQAQQAMQMSAQTYQSVLGRPLRAAEVYLEINYAHGGNDAAMQNAVFAIGAYESYVASFPKDPKVAEANRRIGVLKDLANYQKLVDESGPKAYDAQFQIASIVTTQLGNWRKGVQEYQKVATNWPKSHLAA